MKKIYFVKVGNKYVKYTNTLRLFGHGNPTLTDNINLAKIYQSRKNAEYKASIYKYFIKEIKQENKTGHHVAGWVEHIIKKVFTRYGLNPYSVKIEIMKKEVEQCA